MPTEQKISINPNIKRLGIVAGSGAIPRQLQQACQQAGIEIFVVGLSGNTDQITPDFAGRIGGAGKIINFLKANDVRDIVMIGAVKVPNMLTLWPDWTALKFFTKAWIKSFGDNSMLSAARRELEEMGFTLHGVHKFLPELLMSEGVIGKISAGKHQDSIKIGMVAARELGAADIGQAVIVKDGHVIAREDKRGTSAMIKTHGQAGAILVKMCKPQQDRDLDLPTIGAQTIKLCRDKGMIGVVGQAGATLLVERDAAIKIANDAGIFVMGASVDV